MREIYNYSDGKKKKCDYTYPYHVNDGVGRAMTAANDILRPAHIGESVEGPEGYMDSFFSRSKTLSSVKNGLKAIGCFSLYV